MAEFRMPSLGADMDAGTLVEWLVKPGDMVRRGDVIATVETQKGLFEVENFEDGVVRDLLVPPGTSVPVGTVLATLSAAGEAPAAGAALAAIPSPATDAATARPPEPTPAVPPPPSTPSVRMPVSPSARLLAAELGVDPATVKGTGPHGAVQRDDVERAAGKRKAAAAAPPPPTPPPTAPPPADFQAGMRQAIAAAMSRANREIPHYYLETPISLEAALTWLEGENLKRSIKDRILPAVLLLKGVARALGDVPELNGYWLDGRHQVQEALNLGFAITLRQGGLIAPAIHNVDLLGLDDLMAAMRDLIARTRAGRLRSSEMTDATITVTNLGDLGVRTVFGVIYPPRWRWWGSAGSWRSPGRKTACSA